MPDGRPDLQGVWNFAHFTPLERPAQFADRETITAEEAAEFQEASESAFDQTRAVELAYDLRLWFDERRDMGNRTSLIVDPPNGRLPPRTADGERRAAARAERRRPFAEAEAAGEYIAAGPEDLGLWARCIVAGNAGPPIRPGPYNNTLQLFQTPGVVALFHEQIHNVRMIPLDGRPHTDVQQWTGESRGHWEGDTLVVETTNLRGDSAATFAVGASEHVRMIERFTRVDTDTLAYEFTVDDPITWTRPWTARFLMTTARGIYEYACHEGNRGMSNVLSAARFAEREAAEDKARD